MARVVRPGSALGKPGEVGEEAHGLGGAQVVALVLGVAQDLERRQRRVDVAVLRDAGAQEAGVVRGAVLELFPAAVEHARAAVSHAYSVQNFLKFSVRKESALEVVGKPRTFGTDRNGP